jgi:hypothetical protein
MDVPPDEGGTSTPRKRVKRFGGWLALQVLGTLIRHCLTEWLNGNGPTW